MSNIVKPDVKQVHMKLIFALFILWLLPFVMTSFFNHPAIDDYWNANAVIAYGKMGAAQYFYHTVSGRYFSLFIMSVCNTLPNGQVWVFKLWPILILALLFMSFYFFYGSFFTGPYSKSDAVLLSCLFVVCHIAGMRSLFEGLYWMSSTVCYQTAICLFATGVGAIVRDLKTQKSKYKLIAITSCLLLPGTVEMAMPVYFFTLILLLYISYQFHFAKRTIIYCLAITVVFAVLAVVNRGNISRLGNNSLTYHPSTWVALWYCLRSVAYYAAICVINPLFISAFLIAGLLYYSKNKIPLAVNKTDFIAGLCYFILSSLAVYLPLHLFESSVPFPRVTTLFFFIFFHACLFIVLFNSVTIFRFINNIKASLKIKNIKAALFVVLVVSAFTTKNFILVCKDIFDGTAMNYNLESYQRYALILSCKKDTCFVPPHKYWPYFAQSSKNEISDPNHFQHMNVFFKKTILFK